MTSGSIKKKNNSSHAIHPHDLLRLPFGNRDALCDTSIESLYEVVTRAVPGRFDIADNSNANFFLQKSNTASIGALRLAATASTPILVRRDDVPYATFRIPTVGNGLYRIGKRQVVEQTGQTAILLSGAPREAQVLGPSYASVHAVLEKDTLRDTLATMLGLKEPRDTKNLLRLNEDRELPLRLAGLSFDDIFRRYFGLIDTMAQQPSAPAMLGLDDAFYRAFVTLLAPALVFGDASQHIGRQSKKADVLSLVCDYIQSRLEQPITLTELEQMSGLSARSLQYAFLNRFQCSPTEWIRRERLSLARERLTASSEDTTVTAVALSCGFGHLGLFARYYHEHFGEYPSATLTRTLAGR
jgi:AraC-like DNA-binding protein